MRVPLFGQLILASFVILVSPGGVVSAQAEQQSFSVRVQVVVQVDNESIKRKIVSYVSRELRSLGDVVVTDHEPRYIIDILALEGAFVSGKPTGTIALSTVLSEPLKETAQGKLLRQVLESKGWEWILVYVKDDNLYVTHWVQSGDTKDLRSLCETLVAWMDSQQFETRRRIWQASQDELSKEKQ